MSRKAFMLTLCPILLATSGCASGSTAPVQIRTVSDYCILSAFITYATVPLGRAEDASNRYDSADTVRQVEAHNSRRAAVCENDAPGTVKPVGG